MISSSRERIWLDTCEWLSDLLFFQTNAWILICFWSRTKSHLVLHGVWGVKCLKPSSYIVLVLVADHFVFQQLTTASKGGLNQLYGLIWVSKPLQNWASDHRALMRAYRISLYSISGALAITSMICLSLGCRRNKEHASCIFLYSSNRMQDWARSCLFHVFSMNFAHACNHHRLQWKSVQDCRMQNANSSNHRLKESEVQSKQKNISNNKAFSASSAAVCAHEGSCLLFWHIQFQVKEMNQRFDLKC